ncbi:cysteine desulfurase [Marinomonas agarivorans]|nr:cysteine desulfurase [Marinomonas agarivorans]
MPFNVDLLRQHFPILSQTIEGHPLVYLDNSATTQKPTEVLTTMLDYYQTSNANVHRGAHFLSNNATSQFEQARQNVANFIHAADKDYVIWTKGATEAINMVAYGIEQQLKPNDEILISNLEHHANLVPWQQLAARTGAILRILPLVLTEEGNVLWQDSYQDYFTAHTKLFACTHVSNALGVKPPIQQLLRLAKSVNALTLLDGAQAVAHYPVNVDELDCDFYVFSGHKMYGPTGIGVLYGKTAALERLTPYQTGGEMVASVSYDKTSFNQLPYRLEAGTPNIEGAIGLAAACQFLSSLPRNALLAWEQELAKKAYHALQQHPKIRLYSPVDSTMVSFTVDGISSTDISEFLDSRGIAVRAGQHCAHPLMTSLGVHGTIRASFACYNTLQEVEGLITSVFEGIELLADD